MALPAESMAHASFLRHERRVGDDPQPRGGVEPAIMVSAIRLAPPLLAVLGPDEEKLHQAERDELRDERKRVFLLFEQAGDPAERVDQPVLFRVEDALNGVEKPVEGLVLRGGERRCCCSHLCLRCCLRLRAAGAAHRG